MNKSQVALDENFPDTPVMPDVNLVSTSTEDSNVGPFHASWQAKKSIDEVAEWYDTSLTSTGWVPTVPMEKGNAASNIRHGEYERNGQVLKLSLIRDDSGKVSISTDIADKRKLLEEEGEEDALK